MPIEINTPIPLSTDLDLVFGVNGDPFYKMADDEILDVEHLQKFQNKQSQLNPHYTKNWDAYKSKYDILSLPKKPSYKPDERLVANFARYIVDSFTGYFAGIPVNIMSADKAVASFLGFFEGYNNLDEWVSELTKICSVFGRAYVMLYVDHDANVAGAILKPTEAYMIYDEGINPRPRYFVHYYKDVNNVLRGSFSDEYGVTYFSQEGSYKIESETIPHGFNGVPAVEFVANSERISLIDPILNLNDGFNKALSEKGNDVDAFSDAYLVIKGPQVDEEDSKFIRTTRIINLFDDDEGDTSAMDAKFLAKPSADATQENYLNRLEKLIFKLSMVVDITDTTFGTSSGIALKMKLKPMSDLAMTMERKFKAALSQMFKLIFSNPVTEMQADDWVYLQYEFTRNIPIEEEDGSNET